MSSYLLTALAAYLIGSIPTGYLLARARGVDIRSVGSGNIGATNVFRILGKTAGITVLLVDALKGFLPAKFLLLGGAFLLGAARPDLRVPFWAAASIWLSGHALFHFWEVAVGICGPSALVRDFPAVTLPAVIGLAITAWAMADARGATTAMPARTS